MDEKNRGGHGLRVAQARRRCLECRKWYWPSRSAAKHQVTCGAPCRLRRRRVLARRRRARHLQDHRVADRSRQQRLRERRREAGNAGAPGVADDVVAAVSRAGLAAEVSLVVRVALESWDREIRLSRAGLERKLLMGIGRSRELLRQPGRDLDARHVPASGGKSRR